MKKYIPYILTSIIGIGLGYYLAVRNADSKIKKVYDNAQLVEDRLNDSANKYQALNNGLKQRNETLNDKIYTDSINYSLERLKTIPTARTTQQEKQVLKKGGQLYGKQVFKNSKRALVASYGSQALNEVELLRRVNSNQKAIIVNCEKVVIIKDTIIVEYKEGLKYAAKKAKKGKLTKGVGIGVIGTVLIGLLVL